MSPSRKSRKKPKRRTLTVPVDEVPERSEPEVEAPPEESPPPESSPQDSPFAEPASSRAARSKTIRTAPPTMPMEPLSFDSEGLEPVRDSDAGKVPPMGLDLTAEELAQATESREPVEDGVNLAELAEEDDDEDDDDFDDEDDDLDDEPPTRRISPGRRRFSAKTVEMTLPPSFDPRASSEAGPSKEEPDAADSRDDLDEPEPPTGKSIDISLDDIEIVGGEEPPAAPEGAESEPSGPSVPPPPPPVDDASIEIDVEEPSSELIAAPPPGEAAGEEPVEDASESSVDAAWPSPSEDDELDDSDDGGIDAPAVAAEVAPGEPEAASPQPTSPAEESAAAGDAEADEQGAEEAPSAAPGGAPPPPAPPSESSPGFRVPPPPPPAPPDEDDDLDDLDEDDGEAPEEEPVPAPEESPPPDETVEPEEAADPALDEAEATAGAHERDVAGPEEAPRETSPDEAPPEDEPPPTDEIEAEEEPGEGDAAEVKTSPGDGVTGLDPSSVLVGVIQVVGQAKIVAMDRTAVAPDEAHEAPAEPTTREDDEAEQEEGDPRGAAPTVEQPAFAAIASEMAEELDPDELEEIRESSPGRPVPAVSAEEEPSLELDVEDIEEPSGPDEAPEAKKESVPPPPPGIDGKPGPASAPSPFAATSPTGPPPPPPEPMAPAEPVVAAPRRKRRARKPWWEQIFDDDYLRSLPHYSERQSQKEVNFIQSAMGIEPGGMVLDLGCGNGRHAVEISSRGYQVVGLDLSLAMLARAAELAQKSSQKINFIHGDMREMAFEATFDGVFCVGTSFGYFDDDTNTQVLSGVHKALKSRGVFVLEIVNRDYLINQQPNMVWFEGDGCVCMEESSFNFITSRLRVKRSLLFDDGRQVEHEFSFRAYCLHEIGQLLHQAGFRVTEVSGHLDTPGAFFGPDSSNLIILAEKRG